MPSRMISASDAAQSSSTIRQDAHIPVRPALPAIMQLALGIWIGTASGYTLVEEFPAEGIVHILIVISSVAAFCLIGLLRINGLPFGKRRTFMHLACMLCLGLVLGGMSGCAGALVYRMQVARIDGISGTMIFRAVDDARESRYGGSIVCRLVSINGTSVAFGPKITVWLPDSEMRFGSRFSAEGMLIGDNGSSTARSRGIAGTFSASEVYLLHTDTPNTIILSLRNLVIDAIRLADSSDDNSIGDDCAVLEALVCGYRKDLFAGDIYDCFKIAGVGHLVAVSGAHLAVMFALLSFGIRMLKVPRKIALCLECFCLGAYLLFSAIPISALRAAVMVSLGLASFVSGRRPAVLNALGLCIIAICVISPYDALSASFILSATSTLGIVLLAGLCSFWTRTLFPWFPKILHETLSLTISASGFSIPFSIALFSQCSLITLISNVLCALLFTPVCAFGLIAATISLVSPALGIMLLRVSMAGCGVLCHVVRVLADIPYACIAADISMETALLGTAGVGLSLWLTWPKPDIRGVRTLGAVTIVIALAIFLTTLPKDRIVMFDVGQGDAILVEAGGRSLLIDTGNESKLLKEALARSHVTHVDGVIITHSDADHCGCLEDLSQLVVIDAVYVARDMISCPCTKCIAVREMCDDLNLSLLGLEVGDELNFGNMSCTVVWPLSFTEEGGNADSLCLLCTYAYDSSETGVYRALFTGDAEHEELERFVYSCTIGDIDIIKVGHHGSQGALSTDTLNSLKPEIALISVGYGNRYGHPTDETLNLLDAASCEVYRTDLSGDIALIFTRRGVEISCER